MKLTVENAKNKLLVLLQNISLLLKVKKKNSRKVNILT